MSAPCSPSNPFDSYLKDYFSHRFASEKDHTFASVMSVQSLVQ